ncbi:type II toxin-antitoxin system RelE/ParE family toxin [Macrococcus brunensis]|nr:type II toxin-antitoxin system RelE/ParE family toxin [Macrococcus brunensis]ULG73291.1 type II toxin-antitoxin system RelE/ParE family toxin [Macrococcus brunensis]
MNVIEEIGIYDSIRLKYVKKLDDYLFEVRSRSGNNQQRAVYFHLEQNQYVITHGFTKKTQTTPLKEIKKADKSGSNILSIEVI